MALTVNTPYARCEVVSQIDSVTIEVDTVTGEPLGANWVGRALHAIDSSADGQWREIVAVDVVNSTITMEYPWRQTTDDPLLAVTNGSRVATDSPAYETSLVENQVLFISYTWDELVDGTNITQDGTLISLIAPVEISAAFVWSVNRTVASYSPATGETYLKTSDAGRYVQGKLSTGGYGYAGGVLRFYTNSSTGIIYWCNNAEVANAILCGVDISVLGTHPLFSRIYGDDRDVIRMIDCTQSGNMSGRLAGTKSFVLRHKAFAYSETTLNVGMIAAGTPFGGTFGLVAQDATQAVYHSGVAPFGGPAVIDGIIAKNLSERFIRCVGANSSSSLTLSNLTWDEQGDLALWAGCTEQPLRFTNSLEVQALNGAVLQAGGRLRIIDLLDAEKYNDTNSAGVFDDIPDLFWVLFSSGDQTIAEGSMRTPHEWRYRRFGVYEQNGSINAVTPYIELRILEGDNPFITLSEAAVGALTGISVDFTVATIGVTENHTLSEIYQYQKWKAPDATNIDDDDPVVASSSSIDLGDWQLTINSATVDCPLGRSVTTTDKIIVTGTALLQTLVIMTEGTLEVNTDFRMDAVASISGSAVMEFKDTTEQPLPAHNMGAGGKILMSGTASGDTFDLRAASFDAASIIENTSGNPITVRIGYTATVPILTETSGTITIDSSVDITLTNANILDGSPVLVWNATLDDEISGKSIASVTGGSGFSIILTSGTDYTIGDTVVLLASHVTGSTYKFPLRMTAQLGTENIVFTDSQSAWEFPTALGIDGSTVTECTTDYVEVQVEVTDPNDDGFKDRYAAFITYKICSELDGVRNWVSTDGVPGIRWISQVIAEFDTDVIALEVINVKAATKLTVLDSFVLTWKDGVTRASAVIGSSIIWKANTEAIYETIPVANAIEGTIAGVWSHGDRQLTAGTRDDEIDQLTTAVAAIPTTPLLTGDARLDNLDAAISGTATQTSVDAIASTTLATKKLAEADLDFVESTGVLRVLERGTLTDLVPPKTVVGTQQIEDASITE